MSWTPRKKAVRYSEKLGERIARRIANGDSWAEVSKEDGMPCYQAYYAWERREPKFAEALRIARMAAAELRADRALKVAENAPEGVPGDRLRVQAFMQRAALDAPERWGGKAAAPAKAAAEPRPRKVEYVFRVRHFERVVAPDGTVSVREVLPEGGSQDDIGKAFRA